MAKKLYKLTDQNGQTYGGCQWGEGVEHTAPGEGDLCTAGWIHAYTDSLLAVLLNPIHANFHNLCLWEGDGDVGKTDYGLKVGCTRFKTLRRIPVPKVTTEQTLRFAILCALKVYKGKDFVTWGHDWLSGRDRSEAAALVAALAARVAAKAVRAAAQAAAEAAALAARVAAEAAAWAAEAALTVRAAARVAAEAAAWAAAVSARDFDLIAIAEEALKGEPIAQGFANPS